jgi:hypothetical protein
MMAFMLTILSDNDSIITNREAEVSRILLDCSRRVTYGETEGKILDTNGNVIGDFGFRDQPIKLPFDISKRSTTFRKDGAKTGIKPSYPKDFGDCMGKSASFCREYEKGR